MIVRGSWLTAAGLALIAAAVVVACNEPPGSAGAARGSASAVLSGTAPSRPLPPAAKSAPTPSRQGSTVARTPEDDALFIADEDASAIHAVSLPIAKEPVVTTTTLPARPAALVISGRRVFATLRDVGGKGALVVLERKASAPLELSEIGRVTLPGDAWGIALSPDESLALVTSAWSSEVSAIDLSNLSVLWSVKVGREPRGVTILGSGDTAYVSHLVGADVTRIDGLRSQTPSVKKIHLPAAPLRSPEGAELSASLGYVALASTSGDRVFFPRHALGALGVDAWFGVPTVDALRTRDDKPLSPARRSDLPHVSFDQVDMMVGITPWSSGGWDVPEGSVKPLVQPRAAVLRPSTNTMLVASEANDHIVELDTMLSDPSLRVVRVYPTSTTRADEAERKYFSSKDGGAPSGIALSADEETAFVFCRSTFDLAVVPLAPQFGDLDVAPARSVHLADDPGGADVSIGRRLFYQAHGTVSDALGCAGCHPDGRDDGHVWHEAEVQGNHGGHHFFSSFAEAAFVLSKYREDVTEREPPAKDPKAKSDKSDDKDKEDVPPKAIGFARQTPMLAGRVNATGPYGWHGEDADLPSRIMDGFGLHRWNGESHDGGHSSALAGHLVTFLRTGLVAPPRETHALSDDEERGKKIFESSATECTKCHGGPEYTDRSVIELAPLATLSGFAPEKDGRFKTPSLLFVGSTPPYMHDGHYDSLESLIENNADRMGKTSQLSADDRKALVAYLETL